MSPRPGFAVAIGLLVGLVLNSCAKPRSLPPAPPQCPGFTITVREINVTPQGGTFQLGGGNQLLFERGAVTANTRFTVAEVTVNGRKVAGVRLEPGTQLFREPVRLRLSYAGCPDIEGKADDALYIGIVDANGTVTSIGGAKSIDGKFVEAYVPHFTDFAIAL